MANRISGARVEGRSVEDPGDEVIGQVVGDQELFDKSNADKQKRLRSGFGIEFER